MDQDDYPTHHVLRITLRQNRRFGSRPGLTRFEMSLIGVIVGVAFMFAYHFRPRQERSPFTFFGVAPGMSLDQLRGLVTGDGKGTVDCRRDFDVYQYCVVKFDPDPGFVVAVVDPKERVILVQAVNVAGLDGVHTEADAAQGRWNGVAPGHAAPPLVDIGDTGVVRWMSPNHHFAAELHYSGSSDPDVANQVILTDTRAVALLGARSPDIAERAKHSGWIAPTAAEAEAAFETFRSERSTNFDQMRATLTLFRGIETGYWNEHHTFTDDASALPGTFIVGASHLDILSATDSGWTARATHPAFPGYSCVAYGGHVPPGDWPVTEKGQRITFAEGSACDALPPLLTPSFGRSQVAQSEK